MKGSRLKLARVIETGSIPPALKSPNLEVVFVGELAKRLHDDTTYTHVWRVAGRVLRGFGGSAEQGFAHATMIVAMLHDIVEDTPLTVAVIERLFGKEVADAVDAITRRAGEDYLREYIPRVNANRMARVVKRADIEDHLAMTKTLRPDQKPRYEAARAML
jgi:(p)ppGpp synthase/HD superfamily hydrolase